MHTVCPHCFLLHAQVDGGLVCASLKRPTYALALGVELHSRYQVGKILGSGGFGVSYLCRDPVLNSRVAIKEYFPRQLAARSALNGVDVVPFSPDAETYQHGLRGFLLEARIIEKIRHENVVRVRDYFEANGTACLVMDFYDGLSLAEHLADSGSLTETETRLLMDQLLSGLAAIHRDKVLHRDIKPGNLYLVAGETMRLIILDFGTAREALGKETMA